MEGCRGRNGRLEGMASGALGGREGRMVRGRIDGPGPVESRRGAEGVLGQVINQVTNWSRCRNGRLKTNEVAYFWDR